MIVIEEYLTYTLHVDVEELRAQASESMLGDLLRSQMQDFSA